MPFFVLGLTHSDICRLDDRTFSCSIPEFRIISSELFSDLSFSGIGEPEHLNS